MRAFVVTGLIAALFGVTSAAVAQDRISNQKLSYTSTSVDQASLATPPSPRPPWSAIGRVNRRPGGFCSGTLVRSNKVLTAAHCIWNRQRGMWIAPDDLHFLAGYHLGKYLVHRRVIAVEMPDHIEMNRLGQPAHPTDDWAILTLARDVHSNHMIQPIDRLRSRRISPSRLGTLVRAGYSPFRPYALSSANCRAIGLFGRSILMHNCDATSEESGYPILVQTRRGWRVLGLQVTTFKRKKYANGLGMAMLVSRIPERFLRR